MNTNNLVQLITENDRITLNELAQRTSLSITTIRRLFRKHGIHAVTRWEQENATADHELTDETIG